MKFVEYSTKELENDCRKWGMEIFKEHHPDLIIYIARAGYLCAKPMAELGNIPLLGVGAVRRGNNIKEVIGPIFAYCPRLIRNILASIEIKSSIHKKKTERKVLFHKSIESLDKKSFKKVLIVDDAVDTGYTMKKVIEVTRKEFPNAEVKSACLNMSCEDIESVVNVDFVLMQGACVMTPFSKDSKEYSRTKKKYYEETNNEYI